MRNVKLVVTGVLITTLLIRGKIFMKSINRELYVNFRVDDIVITYNSHFREIRDRVRHTLVFRISVQAQISVQDGILTKK